MPSPTLTGAATRADIDEGETPRATFPDPTLIRLIARALEVRDYDRPIATSPADETRQRVRFRVD